MQPNISAALGTNLFHQLEKLREEKGQVTVEDAGAIVAKLMQSGNQHLLQQEIAQMVRDIDTVKKEILSLSSGDQTNEQAMSDASLHLDTVIKSTEEATNSIMDAAEALGKLAAEIGGPKEQALRDICTRIYEACNFQDLATQRITKVIKLIRTLEGHILNMVKLFNLSATPGKTGKAAGDPLDEKNLLSGPALPKDAVSQDDIDSLFKSLGGQSGA